MPKMTFLPKTSGWPGDSANVMVSGNMPAVNTLVVRDDTDPLAPQREAAFFYGLFLRGHSADALRQDIDVPRTVADKWVRAKDFAGAFRKDLDRVYQYRKQVLAIFDGLVSSQTGPIRIQ